MNKKQLRALLILCGADTLLLVLVLVAMLKLGHPWEYIAAGYCILSSIPLALLVKKLYGRPKDPQNGPEHRDPWEK